MGFIDSYKHLEKLCGDVLGDERRVSAYIDEMLNLPRGTYLVAGWNEDLKTLKHYRWVRNRIVHDPGCTEENMCEPGDALWLDSFYSRIMNQTDPLALYYKVTRPRPAQKPKSAPTIYTYSQQRPRSKKNNNKPIGFVAFLIGALLLIAAIIFISKVL
ncbi:DUF6548 family protein [uncultured Neglectibacter sp.]|uniref:DUF6548 family protein n=1 Tax=uncultured Neglectibacter sp. TaxID=1924108 RepID=UPI0034DED1D0